MILSFTLLRCFRNLKPFSVNRNRSWTRQTHNRDKIKYLTNLVFLVRTVSQGSSFFPPRFMAKNRAINRREKISVRNFQYGPQTRFVRGVNFMSPVTQGDPCHWMVDVGWGKLLISNCPAVWLQIISRLDKFNSTQSN